MAGKLDEFVRIVGNYDVVILSDYGKGGLTHVQPMIHAARQAGKAVLIDPKGSDWSGYHGATLLTPNKNEFALVAGAWKDEAHLESLAREWLDKLSLDALLLTRSEEGMSLFTRTQTIHEPTVAREVFDVSGAGDTVIGTLALMMASGVSMEDSMKIANIAAGIVVGKLGTAVVTLEELRAVKGRK